MGGSRARPKIRGCTRVRLDLGLRDFGFEIRSRTALTHGFSKRRTPRSSTTSRAAIPSRSVYGNRMVRALPALPHPTFVSPGRVRKHDDAEVPRVSSGRRSDARDVSHGGSFPPRAGDSAAEALRVEALSPRVDLAEGEQRHERQPHVGTCLASAASWHTKVRRIEATYRHAPHSSS